MSILFLFGAGASKFCGANTVEFLNPITNQTEIKTPPLGNELYEELIKLQGFEELKNCPQDIKDIFLTGERNFELGFEKFLLSRSDPNNMPLNMVAGVANYFISFSLLSKNFNNNLYYRLIQEIKRYKYNARFATLNYDMLLDSALNLNSLSVLSASNNHTKDKEAIEVAKPHGAPNIFAPNVNNHYFNVKITGSGEFLSNEELVYYNLQESRDRLKGYFIEEWNKINVPAMCMYLKNKRAYSFKNYISKERAAYKKLILEAKKIVVIGAKITAHDEHIWNPLRETKADIALVNPIFFTPEIEMSQYEIMERRNSLKFLKNSKRLNKKVLPLLPKFSDCFNGQELSKKLKKFIS